MPYEQKEGDIAVFVVKDKTNERGPDWTGRALIDGKERDVSLWFKSDTMLAGQVKPKWVPDYDEAKQPVQEPAPVEDDGVGEEIPW